MRKEWKVERQGKEFVLYAGILDMAHEKGLKSITTELLQIPSENNNRIAICRATVVMLQDGMEKTFTGLGDAAPNNVAPAMQTVLIRMSETRAKARALRDAVNIGEAAFEELGEEEQHPQTSHTTNLHSSSGGNNRPTVEKGRQQPQTHGGDFGQSGAQERAATKATLATADGRQYNVDTQTGEIVEEETTPEMRFEAACRQLRVSWWRSSENKKVNWAKNLLYDNSLVTSKLTDAQFIKMAEVYENYLDAIGDDVSLRQHDVIVAEVMSILPAGAKVESFYHISANQWKLLSGRIRSLKLKESKKYKQRSRFFALAAQEAQVDGSIGRWKTEEGKDDAESMREWIRATIDRDIKSRTELAAEEWQICADRLQFEMEQREELVAK